MLWLEMMEFASPRHCAAKRVSNQGREADSSSGFSFRQLHADFRDIFSFSLSALPSSILKKKEREHTKG